ncbi:hypothetical protein PHJA_000601500 [Phtheirospermum japonicum]|uniref:Uncharacterized protein n=1 Tax=Phtheirospermum japonicum TaxID=374723 RepID=A0A830BC21_9LAMI|nr:hypothetical protein PHJA_000601500 [Phtheirospermum japonicum]
MEGNLRSEASNPTPPPTAANICCNSELARSSSDASSPTAGNRKDILRCSPNMAPNDDTAWTNEKHNLYLHHLELSFVTQLHQSKSLLHKRLTNVKNASEKVEFKVLRNGCCQASLKGKLVYNFKCVDKNWSTAKRGKSTISSGLATCSQDSLDLKREGTGQNFMDGVNQSTLKFESQAKRSKTALAESSLQDQVIKV